MRGAGRGRWQWRRPGTALLAGGVVLLLVACAPSGGGRGSGDAEASTPSADGSTAPGVVLPPAGVVPDYQLGGAYEPAEGVGVVARDRSAPPAAGRYSICYVNGFQTQPGELEEWPAELLLQRDGAPVFDPDWPDEALLDHSTPERRAAIAALVGPWIAGCAEAGYDAVEFDNLDSYTRSHGALTLDGAVELAGMLVAAAHALGLAAGQKNAAEDAAVLRERAGFDFAVTEECAAYEECGAYAAVYGDRVIDIEYADELPVPFAELCRSPDAPRSMVLRDRQLTVPGEPAYVFETC
ncbi:endo alpha-1,4 polygalactosaminidase [Agromyces soli]|uniref:Endo alpha-1,4 polygalactosaminidase n=1 Tax=Agromyces soli TaxID=659012 RepID=A0ABY4APS1_9MICO|nr:endo alpha-1,4 polygalactosaminidase [Agromyces soli]UOE25157.1 endo alpha-1,4 polygalactosaminidase [Agromyces soli]